MNLYLVRHGNTFDTGQKVVWAGSQDDLPLVQKGVAQAEAAAKWFLDNNVDPAAIYCGPLSRTRTFADIISATVGSQPPVIDNRLNELDYGEWSGLTDSDVAHRFGQAELRAWRDEGRWPSSGNWGQSDREVFEEASSFLKDMAARFSASSDVIAVSSNGRLKYFLKACKHNIDAGEVSVKTGHFCKLRLGEGGFEVVFWNKKPG